MPELMPRSPFLLTLRQIYEEHATTANTIGKTSEDFARRRAAREVAREKIRNLEDEFPEEISQIIGSGRENLVVAHPLSKDKVVAVVQGRNLTPQEAHVLFYTHRIMKILFPHNFPTFYAAWGSLQEDQSNSITGTIRERIVQKDPPQDRFAELMGDENRERARYPFKKVERFVKKYGLPILFDSLSTNFRVNKADKGEYYLDKIQYPDEKDTKGKSWNTTRILGYMESARDGLLPWSRRKRYSKEDLHLVKVALEKLQQLGIPTT